MDSHDDLLVASGNFACNTNPVTMIPDIELVHCDGENCELNPLRSAENKNQGVLHFYHTERYSERKYYLVNSAQRNTNVASVKLLHESKTHQVMSVVKDVWGVSLSSF